jgi:hypothetical protein
VRFLGHEQQRGMIESLGLRFEPYQQARPWSATARASELRRAGTISRGCLAAAQARNVPQRGTVRTSPSAARVRSTRVTVAWEAW